MRLFLLITFFGLIGAYSQAQSEVNSTKTVAVIKASYVYNFSKYCKWENTPSQSDKFKIAVYGDSDLYEELIDKYSTRPINSKQTVEVVWIKDPEDLTDEQVVFVSKTKKSELQRLATLAEKNHSLLITDFSSALTFGAVINFVVIDHTLAFNVNKKQAALNGIMLGNRIIDWANKIIE